jgi:hypothetical protein
MPDVDVIERLPPQEAYERQTECLIEAALPGVTVSGSGGWTYQSVDGEQERLAEIVERQWWLCNQQYPIAYDDVGVLSESELAWLHDFYANRYRPCLASFGFSLVDFPTRAQFVGDGVGYPLWIPHDWSVAPLPNTEQWKMLALRCPLPSMLDSYVLPGSLGTH